MKKLVILQYLMICIVLANCQSLSIDGVIPHHCTNTTLNVPYTVTGTFNSGNTFTLELSDASGNFGTTTNLQSINSTTSGTFSASVPSIIPQGSGYRVRVVATDPIAVSAPSNAFIVSQYINTGTLTGVTYRCQCTSYNIYQASNWINAQNFSYTLTPPGAGFVTLHNGTNALVQWNPNYTGIATLTLTASNLACTNTASINITTDPQNTVGVDMSLFQFVGTQFFDGQWSNYYRSLDQRTWQQAKTTCENSCGNLVGISSSSERLYITNNFFINDYRWIGGTDERVEGDLDWISSETWYPSVEYWFAPNNTATDDYVRIMADPHIVFDGGWTLSFSTDQGWDLTNGSQSHYYILERKNNQTTTALTPNGGQLCSGSTYTLSYTVSGAFDNGNIFYAELSDANGDFTNSQYIGNVSSTSAGTISITIPANTPAGNNYRIRVASSKPFSPSKTTTAALTINYPNPPTVSLSASPSTSVCAGFVTTFTATPNNGGVSSNYNFLVNGVSQQNTTSNIFNTTSLTNGQNVNCIITRNDACASPSTALSNTLTMSVNTDVRVPAVSIAITSGSQNICSGATVTFTATPTNGGTTPIYNFKVNGTSVQMGNLATYTTSTLTNGQSVTCDMTSSYVCPNPATVTSNAIAMTVNNTVYPHVAVSSDIPLGTFCASSSATFAATPTYGGTTPVYAWYKNGSLVGSSSTYTNSTWANGDVINCKMTSNAACPLPATVWSVNHKISIENTTPDSWQQKASMDVNNGEGISKRSAAAGFSIGNKGYVGTGLYSGTRYKDFWEYDPTTNVWTQRADFGGTARYGAVGFSVGSKGYIATGFDGANKQDVWEYDPATNTWTSKANFPGTARRYATAFTIGNKAYVGTGNDGANKQDFFEYNPASNTWSSKANFPAAARQSAAGFSIGDRGYLGTGTDGGSAYYKDFYEYNPATNIWTQKADLSGTSRAYAVGFSIGSKGYLGLGFSGSTGIDDLWEFTPGTNSWLSKATFQGSPRSYSVSFVVGSSGYVATGDDGTLNNDLWEYKANTDSWNIKLNSGQTRRVYAASFSIANKGYICTGEANSLTNDLWEYNQSTNSWTQKADFPGMARTAAVGFSIGGRGYVGTGLNGTTRFKDFYEYDPYDNDWTQKADFGGTARYSAVGFSIGNKGYVGTGFDGANKQDFWEYNPSNDTWVVKASFPGTARRYAAGFSIGAKGYAGTGFDGAYKNDFYEYDQSTNTWSAKANFGGSARREAISFSIGGKGYLGTGYNGTLLQNFYEYDPSTNVWTQHANFPGSARYAATGFSIGNKGYLATGIDASGGLNDLWEYTPTNTTQIVTGSIYFPSSICAGSTINVPYTIGCTNFNAGNVFTAQLSDAHGTFSNPINIGSVSAVTSGSITATIPALATPGTEYRIRIMSSDPVTYGTSNHYDIPITAQLVWYLDFDNDNYYTGVPVTQCSSPGAGYKTFGLLGGNDCNDANSSMHATFSFYVDSDNDGFGAGSLVNGVCAINANVPPVGYSTNNTDCAPNDNTKWQLLSGYVDSDGDGYTVGSLLNNICSGAGLPSEYVATSLGGDCDDNNAAINPAAAEVCNNGIDDNCNGNIDEGCFVCSSVPAKPSIITGPTQGVCAGTTGVVYSVDPQIDATGYQWTMPPQATLISGQGSNSIVVDFSNNFANGNIIVRAINNCGQSARQMNVITALPTMPGISGPKGGFCLGQSNVEWSVDSVVNALSYFWTIPNGVSITGGQNTRTLTANIANGFTSGQLCVGATNACGKGSSKCVTITGAPEKPKAINGSNNLCPGVNGRLKILPVNGATTYNWTLPSGFTIVSGNNTNDIRATWGGVTSTASIIAENACGISPASSRIIKVNTNCRMGEESETNNESMAMKVFPNPTNSQLNIQLQNNNDAISTIELYDLQGRKVMSENAIQLSSYQAHTIDVGKLSTGIYQMRVVSENMTEIVRVVIE